MDKQVLIEKFQIPREGYDIIDRILTKKEQQLIFSFPAGQSLTPEELGGLVTELAQADDVETYIARLFHRGILNHTEDGKKWCLGTFYGRLDIFATEETQSYDELSRQQKEQLDAWYFKAYAEWLDTLDETAPTQDEDVYKRQISSGILAGRQ